MSDGLKNVIGRRIEPQLYRNELKPEQIVSGTTSRPRNTRIKVGSTPAIAKTNGQLSQRIAAPLAFISTMAPESAL